MLDCNSSWFLGHFYHYSDYKCTYNFYLRLNKELTYDPYDESVAGEGDEGEDGVDDAEEDDDGGVVRLVLADLVDHTESLLRYMVGHY